MQKLERLIIFIFFFTVIFARMDWNPIHASYIKYNDWPHPSVETWWHKWALVKDVAGYVICPPCKALAEHYYFVLFEMEAGIAERDDLLLKHIPAGHEYEGVLSPSGFWMGQGGEDNSNEWKLVSLSAWWLYWLFPTIIWWYVWARDVIYFWRRPWWMRKR
jgi:hypothetical protein